MAKGIRRNNLLVVALMVGVLVGCSLAVLSSAANAQAQDATSDPVLVAAGNLARCTTLNDEATAALVGTIGGTVAALGDNAYHDGSDRDYQNCHAPSWGAYKDHTLPTPGNHDYVTPGASGYFKYFGAAAGDPTKGYYSYDLGSWHIVVLNDNCSKVGGCASGSPQGQWLKADLASHRSACTLAYWHQPRFSSSSSGTLSPVKPFWDELYKMGAEIVLNAHRHNYERFAPQTPGGGADPAWGIREFVVGTGGGASLEGFTSVKATSEERDASTYGVLRLALHPDSYDWRFVPVEGQTFTDSGTADCHDDTTPPVAQPPSQGIPANSTLDVSATSTIPVKLSWSATDNRSVTGYVLEQSTDGGATFERVPLSSPTATTKTLQLQPDGAYQFRVKATDGIGNLSEWATGPSFVVDPEQEDSGSLSYAGAWTHQASDAAHGGATSQSATTNSTAQFAFSGRNVAWVATKGPDGGRARVFLDGTAIATVDLYASTSQPRQVVFSKGGLDPSVAHTLTVRVLGTKNASSSGTRVDVDALVALR